MELLCQLQNIHLSFGDKTIFQGAQFSLHFGEKVGLLGLNGQGKSTLFKILTGEVVPDPAQPPFHFAKVSGKDNSEKYFSVFHVPQQLPVDEQRPDLSIEEYVLFFYPHLRKLKEDPAMEALNDFGEQGGWDLLNSYESYLKLFGVEDWTRAVKNLSGGEQRKLALALGLSSRHQLVLWDEPTNHLDMETIELFEEELLQCEQTILLITHDRYLLNRVCTRLLHIQQGQIESFTGSYFDYLNFLKSKEHQRVQLLDKLQNHMRREDAWMKQGIKARGTRSKKRVENFHDLQAKINHLRFQSKKSVELGLHASQRKTKQIAVLKNVTLSFKNKESVKVVLKEVSTVIFKGEKIALLGLNGSGKTSFIRLLMGEYQADSGEVKLAEQLNIHYFSQKREVLNEEKTPYQMITEGEGKDMISLPGGRQMHINAYCESFLIPRSSIHRPISSFSGGEKNRLQLALFLRKEADFWIFDEPTNDLDLETLTILEDNLKNFPGTVLIVSHDRAFLEQIVDRALVLHRGQLENFEGGMEQAMLYLKEVILKEEENEEKLGSKAVEEINIPKKMVGPAIPKLSSKEKKRLEELPLLIEKKEEQLSQLEKDLLDFDFSKLAAKDGQGAEELQTLQKKKEELQAELDSLFNEWETLGG